MADKTQQFSPMATGSLDGVVKKLVDMGDGTHAERVVVVTGGGSGGVPVGGGITWGVRTEVTIPAGPTSVGIVSANPARKGIMIWNPIGNAQMSVRFDGGPAVLVTDFPLLAGDKIVMTGAECPVTGMHAIGTAGQKIVVVEGT